jgi:hypothetical protein
MKFLPLIFSLLLVLNSCQPKKEKTNQPIINADGSWVKKTYYEKSGAIKSEITVKNKKKNGPAKEYYPSGNLRSLVQYTDNVTVGETIWYYENGNPYRVTPYVNGQIEGIRKIYYEDGRLQAVIPYKSNELMFGTIEYDIKGKKIINQASIVFETQDLIAYSNKYLLKMRLSNNSPRVKFFQERISTEGTKIRIPVPYWGGTGVIEYSVFPGNYKMEIVTIYAEYKSKLGNPVLFKGTYNLAYDSR